MDITGVDPFGNVTYSLETIPVSTNSTRHKSKNGETHKVKASDSNITMDWVDVTKLRREDFVWPNTEVDFSNPPKSKDDNEGDFGYKEKEGKLFYELDWDFITQMAERMAANKKEDKYELFNWKKKTDVEEIKQALFRHVLDIMKGEYEDDGQEYGHILAAADNLMILHYQLKNINN